ncbi:MAG: hypothetical protein WDM71_03160 [Ferruginibacter sp.]
MMSYAKDYETFIEKLIPAIGIEKQTLNIKKGQAIIWSANLLHGGEKINTPWGFQAQPGYALFF